MFGVSFDPWGTPSSENQHKYLGKNALEVSDLLGLDDHSTISDVQSEDRAAGVEQPSSNHLDLGGMKSHSSGSSVAGSDQFDPFGTLLEQPSTSTTATPLQPQPAVVSSSSSLSTDPLFNLLMDTPTTATTNSTSSAQPSSTTTFTTNAVSRSTGSSPDPFASLLTPTTATTQQQNGATLSPRRHAHHASSPPTMVTNLGVGGAGGSTVGNYRRVSQPPRFNDHLSPLHSAASRQGGGGLGFVTSHSQPNLAALGSSGGLLGTSQQLPHQLHQLNQSQQRQGFGGVRANPSYMGGGSASTSPRSMSPTPFGAHSSSTGNLLQGSTAEGGKATLAGQTSSSSSRSEDPFAQFNLGFMAGSNSQPPPSSVPHKSPSQPVFKPQPTHPAAYQPYYMRPEANSTQGGPGKAPQSQQPQAKAPTKSTSGSSIGSSSSSVFAPRKPNYNPVMGPESKTGVLCQ